MQLAVAATQEKRRTARKRQVAALCFRPTPSGPRILLITSRGTGRWILPKGWPIQGLSEPETALQEAWEEAGVRAERYFGTPIGAYRYDKLLKNGDMAPVEANVYAAQVAELSDEFPESAERRRRWFAPVDAAARVAEPTLRTLLTRL